MKITNENKRFMKTFSVLSIALMLTLAVPAIPLSYGGVTPVCTAPPANMVSWWPLDENSGETTASDIVGDNTGSYVNSPAQIGGLVDGALSFVGVTDYVEVPDDISLQPQELTIDAWVRGSDIPGSNGYIVAKGADGCSSPSYALYSAGASVKFLLTADGASWTSITGPNIWDGEWHHVAGTYDGSFMTLYVDGGQVAQVAYDKVIDYTLSTHDDLIFGSYEGTCSLPFNGDVDEIELFSRALDSSEIEAIFDADFAGKCKEQLVDVAKFYDANYDGIHDEGEVFLEDWLVHVNDTNHEFEFTNATYVLQSSETFTATEFIPDDYVWIPTNDTVVTFNSDDVDEIWFSNVCVDESGENPHSKGFWSNKNGQKLCEEFEISGVIEGNLTQFPNFVDSDNEVLDPLIDQCGDVVHDKASKPPTKNYLKKPTHGNINYTLSQQLLTMVLNNATESINPADDVYCHSIGLYFNLTSLMMEANATLADGGSYDAGDLAECLDDANNDMNYVQDEACEYDFDTTLTVSKVLTDELGATHENTTNVPFLDGSFWWNVTVSNTGLWPAVNANLTDISNSTANHSNLNDCNDAGTETFCDFGDLENGTVTQIDIAGEVDNQGDVVVNTASTIAENALEAIYVLVNTIFDDI